MKSMNATQTKKYVEAILENGVTTRERYLEAVPALFAMDKAIASAKDWIDKLKALRDGLSARVSDYAVDHATALDEPVTADKDGISSGTVEIGGVKYRLTVSSGDFVRKSGGNLTKEFLSRLPKDWTKAVTKLQLDKASLKGKTADELEAEDLFCPVKRVWSVVERA